VLLAEIRNAIVGNFHGGFNGAFFSLSIFSRPKTHKSASSTCAVALWTESTSDSSWPIELFVDALSKDGAVLSSPSDGS
jgi:hypothetical protein